MVAYSTFYTDNSDYIWRTCSLMEKKQSSMISVGNGVFALLPENEVHMGLHESGLQLKDRMAFTKGAVGSFISLTVHIVFRSNFGELHRLRRGFPSYLQSKFLPSSPPAKLTALCSNID